MFKVVSITIYKLFKLNIVMFSTQLQILLIFELQDSKIFTILQLSKIFQGQGLQFFLLQLML